MPNTPSGRHVFEFFGKMLKLRNPNTHEDEISVILSWKDVAKRISDLIYANEYLIGEERDVYKRQLRFREERHNAKSDTELVKIIANQYRKNF